MGIVVRLGLLILVLDQIIRVSGGVVFVQINVLEVVEEVTVVQGEAEDMVEPERQEEQEEMVVRQETQKVGKIIVLPQLHIV
jgi:hypothetical protein